MNWKHILPILCAVVAGVALGAGFAGFSGQIVPERTAAGRALAAVTEPATETVPAVSVGTTLIRPADSAVDRVTAAGNIELVDTQQVVARVNGYVDEVLVEVGDVVSSGDLLVALDRDDLRRAVDQARINLTSAELQLESLLADASAAYRGSPLADMLGTDFSTNYLCTAEHELALAAENSPDPEVVNDWERARFLAHC